VNKEDRKRKKEYDGRKKEYGRQQGNARFLRPISKKTICRDREYYL